VRFVFGILFLMIVVVGFIVAGFFGLFAFRGPKRPTPLVYRCLRCAGEFRRPAHHDFPAACPLCHTREWNA